MRIKELKQNASFFFLVSLDFYGFLFFFYKDKNANNACAKWDS